MKCGRCKYYDNGWFGLGVKCEKKKKIFYFAEISLNNNIKNINKFNFIIDVFCRSFKIDLKKSKQYSILSPVE
jgi:hypothetical protein